MYLSLFVTLFDEIGCKTFQIWSAVWTLMIRFVPETTCHVHRTTCCNTHVSLFTFSQKHKKKKKAEVFNFSAIHLIHDPQGNQLCSIATNPYRISFFSFFQITMSAMLLQIFLRSSWSSWRVPKSVSRWRSCWWSSSPDWWEFTRYGTSETHEQC